MPPTHRGENVLLYISQIMCCGQLRPQARRGGGRESEVSPGRIGVPGIDAAPDRQRLRLLPLAGGPVQPAPASGGVHGAQQLPQPGDRERRGVRGAGLREQHPAGAAGGSERRRRGGGGGLLPQRRGRAAPEDLYFYARGQTYEQAAVIEGTGTSIYSVAYEDLDQDGWKELLVGWRVNTDIQALSVYSPAVRRAGGADQRHQLCEIRRQRPEPGRAAGAGGPPGRRGGQRRGGLLLLGTGGAPAPHLRPDHQHHGGAEPAGAGQERRPGGRRPGAVRHRRGGVLPRWPRTS